MSSAPDARFKQYFQGFEVKDMIRLQNKKKQSVLSDKLTMEQVRTKDKKLTNKILKHWPC